MALTPTTGTVSITGNLSVDITVNGNLTVSGAISSNAKATGTISYGSLTGIVESEAELEECDIQVDGGTLTFAAGVSEGDDGEMYTEGQVTNASGVSTTFYGRLVINGTANNQLYNNGGTFTIASGAYISVTSSNYTSGGSPATINAGTFTIENGAELMSAETAISGVGGQNNSGATLRVYGKATFTAPNSVVSGDGGYDGFRNLGTFVVGDGGDVTIYGEDRGLYSYSSSALTIEKGGKMDVSSTQAYGTYHTAGSISVAGELSTTTEYTNGYGLYASSAVTVQNYGHLTATAVSGSSSYGIYNTSTFTTEAGSEVEATGVGYGMRNTSTTTIGGILTAEGTGSSGIGLYNSAGTMNIEETSEISASGATYGAQTAGTINFYGIMTAEGSYGLYNTGTFNANGELTSIANVSGNPGIRNTGTIVVGKTVRAYNSEG